MPEITTCEQYVLNLLEENQNYIVELEAKLNDLSKKRDFIEFAFSELRNLLIDNISVSDFRTSEGETFRTFSLRLFEDFDKDQVDLLLQLVPELKEKINN